MQGIRAMLSRQRLAVLAATTLGVLGSAGAASAATYTVTTQADANDGSCTASQCSLRDAVVASDAAGGSNTIVLPAGDYKLTIAPACTTTTFTSNVYFCDPWDPTKGDLDVTGSNLLTITGAGSGSTTIDANQLDRAFSVQSGSSLSLSGLTIQNGSADNYLTCHNSTTNSNYTCYPSEGYNDGGAIYSEGGVATTADTVLRNSFADGDYGGAIYANDDSGSTLSLNGATFDGDGAWDYGGALYDDSPNTISITNSVFTGNYTDDEYGGAIYGDDGGMSVDKSTFSYNNAYEGGAIYWDTNTQETVTNSTFNANGAYYGGALADEDSSATTLTNDSFTDNSGSNDGGALYLDASSTTAYTLDHDVFNGNTAVDDDGGAIIWYEGTLSSNGSTFTNNSAYDGGAIYMDSGYLLTLVNATISNNRVTDDGGGINVATSTPATLTNDTIAFNAAPSGGYGGGIYDPSEFTSNPSTPGSGNGAENTIVAENGGGDCDSAFSASFDVGHNLDSDSSCFGGIGAPGDKVGVDPKLGQPADNGGPQAGDPNTGLTPILTDAELSGSPAIDAGSNTGCPATDARGVTRPQGAACDIGAFEAAAAGLSLSKSGPSSADTNSPVTYTITAGNGGPGPSTGTTVVDQLPAGMTLYGATPSQGSCSAAGSPAKVTCDLGNLNSSSTGSNTSATVQLVVAEANAGPQTNTATATNDQGSSQSASATTTFTAPVAPSNATAPTAVTGPATAISKTSAKLTGAVAPGNQPTAYFFQYGTSSHYGEATAVLHTGSTAQAVSAVIKGLKQGTRYHFRLVAINDSGSSFGAEKSFKTKGTSYLGSLVLIGRRLPVKNGRISARFACRSSKRCFGLFSVTAKVRVKHHKFATIVCTKSKFAKYSIPAHRTRTVSVPVHAVCVAYAKAHHGHLRAKLSTRPRSAQRGLVRLVTVVLR